MKTQHLLLVSVSVLSIFIFSCQQEKPQEKVQDQKITNWYRAVSGRDSAWLSIDTTNKIINGQLTFNYPDKKERYEGKFKGEMYGDTLKGHYDFKINNAEKWNRNPVAFLKKDCKLIMGVGQFMLVMGSGHFDDRVPIDYDKGRFIFGELKKH